MGLAETASLIVDLRLKGGFSKSLMKEARALVTFDARLGRTESRAARAGQQIGTGIRRGAALAAGGLAFLAGNVAIGLDSLVNLEQQVAQTNAVLKSTKGVAGITAQAVGQLAEKYEGLNAVVGDEVIRSTENMLLTFTNIRKKAFEPSLKAILDLNTALGRGEGGLQQTTIAVGKALNDPVRGITALRRVGVAFTKAQEKKIKSLVKEGKLYEAQKIVLRELNTEFGGSFEKQGATTAGRIAKFKDSVEDLQRALARALLPTLGNVADALTKLLADPTVIRSVEDFGKQLAGLFSEKNLASGARVMGDFITAAKEAAPGIIAGAKTAGAIIGTAVKLFQSLPPEIQKLAIGGAAINKLTGGLVTNIAGGLIGAVLKQLAAGVVNVNGGVVNVNGGIPGGGLPGGAAKTGLSGIAKVALVGEAIGLAALVNSVREGIGQQSTEHAQAIAETQKVYLSQSPTTEALKTSLAGVQQGIKDIQSNPLLVLVRGDALSKLQQMETDLKAALARKEPKHLGVEGALADLRRRTPGASPAQLAALNQAAQALKAGLTLIRRPGTEQQPGKLKDDLVVPVSKTTAAVHALRDATLPKIGETTTAVQLSKDAITAAQNATKDKVATSAVATQATTRSASLVNANITAGATRAGTSAIVAAIWAARPTITVSNITRSTTYINRYGPPTGSNGTDTYNGGH